MNTINYLLVAVVLILAGAFVSPKQFDGIERGSETPPSGIHMDLT